MSNNRGGSRRTQGQFRAQTGGGGLASFPPNPAPAGPNPPIHQLMNPSMMQTSGGPGGYHNQQSRRPALLSQPMTPQNLTLPTQIQSVPTVPTTQRQHLQQRYPTGQVGQPPTGAIYNPHTHMTLQQQQAAVAAAAFQSQFYPPYQPQAIYSGNPAPMPPIYSAAATLRGQHHQYGGVGTGQQVQQRIYQPQKRASKVLRIVDDDTKETLDVEKLKLGGAGTSGAMPITSSGSQTDATKRSQFREQMQVLQLSDVIRINAFIKEDSTGVTPTQEIHTRQSKPIKIRVGTGQQVQPRTCQPQKRATRAVAIVNATTKETLDVEKLKSGGAGTSGATPVTLSGSQSDATKRTQFREQMQEIQSSDVVKPNALISDAGDSTSDTPKQEIHTRQSKPIKIIDPAPPTKSIPITDPPISEKPVIASESKPVKQVTAPEPQKPVIDVKSDVSILPQPVKLVISSEAPPTSPVSSMSEVSVKEETVGASEDKKDKTEEEKTDDVLPTSDRSSTGLKSDPNTCY